MHASPIRRYCFVACCVILLLLSSTTTAQLCGFEIIDITDNPDLVHLGGLNNCGEVVFSRRINQSLEGEEIFLHDNGRLIQFTNNNVRDAYPDINDNSAIEWVRAPDGAALGTLVLYRNGVVTEIGPGSEPDINNQEHMVFPRPDWGGCGGGDAEVFFFNGDAVVQVSDLGLANHWARLNEYDRIAWTRYDFCATPWWDSEIMFYADGTITQLTEGQFEPQGGSINNVGQVVWSALDLENIRHWIYIWQDGVLDELGVEGRGPYINNLGHIAFSRVDYTGLWQSWLHRHGEVFQLTDDAGNSYVLDFNDWGEVLLSLGMYPDTDRRLMRRIRTGDSGEGGFEVGFDGDIDLRDFAVFQRCITGPGDFDRLCDCRFLDIDHDRDVDLDDFTLFTAAMTGPG